MRIVSKSFFILAMIILVALPVLVARAADKPPVEYLYKPYMEGKMDPQLTGWPLTEAEIEYIEAKPAGARWPGNEPGGPGAPQVLDMVPVTPIAGGSKGYENELKIANQFLLETDMVDILLVGDSITGAWEGYVKERPFISAWMDSFGQYKTINLGKAGENTAGTLWRLDHTPFDHLKQPPRVCVLQIGHNNMYWLYNGVSKEAVTQGIVWCAKNLRARFPRTPLILVNVFPTEGVKNAENEYAGDLFNEGLSYARNRLNEMNLPATDSLIHVLDIWDNLLNPDGTQNKELFMDAVHLNSKGYALWANKLKPVVEKLLGGKISEKSVARAEVTPHPLLCKGMVLQRNADVPIWGWAEPGETVIVEFGMIKKTATADANGKWLVELAPMPASSEPRIVVISDSVGGKRAEIANVVVGEVWICAGQSNMEVGVSDALNPDEEIKCADFPLIRMATINKTNTREPQDKAFCSQNEWKEALPSNVGSFSAVGYFFARELHQALKVPIGMIHASWGGTPAEAWTSWETLASDPDLKPILDQSYHDHQKPGGLYNGMIRPLAPYALRGAIWYQGEDNLGRAMQYRKLLPALISDWRTLWNKEPEDFPFGIVSLAPFGDSFDFPYMDWWSEIREAQELVSRMPGNGLAVTIDLGDGSIHPRNKQDVGKRLSYWALNKVYGKPIEYSGSFYKSMKVEGDKIRLSFDPLGGGIVAKDGPLTFFSIAGEDRVFQWADAVIEGDEVVAHSPKVPEPVAVRYAWSHGAATKDGSRKANLYGKNGLPVPAFRTDDWADR